MRAQQDMTGQQLQNGGDHDCILAYPEISRQQACSMAYTS